MRSRPVHPDPVQVCRRGWREAQEALHEAQGSADRRTPSRRSQQCCLQPPLLRRHGLLAPRPRARPARSCSASTSRTPGAASPVRATPTQLTSQLTSLHAESQRWQLDWQAVEPFAPVDGEHSYYWNDFDPMYQADIAAGIKPLIIVTNAPKWAWPTNAPTGPGSPGWGFPPGRRAPRRLGGVPRRGRRRYPQAAGIEVWNEPNHPAYWGRGYSSNYSRPCLLLAAAAARLRRRQVGRPRDAGDRRRPRQLAGHQRRNVAALDFAKAMFANGAADYMDAISIHPYPQSFAVFNYTLFTLGIDQMRTARETVGASTPIWVTEVGVSTTGADAISESDQASALTDIFHWIQTQADIEAFFVHALSEPDQDTTSAEMGYALMRGARRPSLPSRRLRRCDRRPRRPQNQLRRPLRFRHPPHFRPRYRRVPDPVADPIPIPAIGACRLASGAGPATSCACGVGCALGRREPAGV